MAALTYHRITRALGRFWLTWRFRLFHRHRHRRLVLEEVAGVPLLVLPEVFNPALFTTSEALARVLGGEQLAGRDVLDPGTGSGIAAIVAARRGARVVAVDVAPAAVRCARINALLNEVEDRMEVLHGDLYEPVHGRRFDLVTFNPPFFAGPARELWELAWRTEDVMDRFARDLPSVLKPGGRAILVLSSEAQGVEAALARCPFRTRVLWERGTLSERFTVVEWQPSAEAVTA